MKLLFLDCDGVINGREWFAKHRADSLDKRKKLGFNIDPVCFNRVKSIIERTGCKVVWTSSWRHLGSNGIVNDNLVKETWKFIGFEDEELYSWTPWLKLCHARAVEIEAWIDCHPEVSGRAVIIDDGRDAFVPEDYRDGLKIKFINTSIETGITDEEVNETVEWMNIED